MARILSILDPINNAEAWHTITVAGVKSPGVCIVKDWKRAHEWDKKKGRGAVGATLTFVQKPPAKGSIDFLLWTPQHFKDWDDFYPLFQYDPTKEKPSGVDMFHPSLAAIDVSSAVTEFVGNPMHQGQGLYQISIEFIEFVLPPNASGVGTADGSIGGLDGEGPNAKKQDDAEDEYDKKIRSLTDEYNRLG